MSNMLTNDIASLLEKGIKNQEQLKNELEKLGYNVSQSNLSRKLKKIGVIRIGGLYQIPKFNTQDKIKVILHFVKPNLIIIKCDPGYASSIATKIDQYLISNPLYPEFIGCIAGDDTIFVAIALEEKNENWGFKQIMQVIS